MLRLHFQFLDAPAQPVVLFSGVSERDNNPFQLLPGLLQLAYCVFF